MNSLTANSLITETLYRQSIQFGTIGDIFLIYFSQQTIDFATFLKLF